MAGLPVTIRLLDPPLHEFLPHADAELAEVAAGARHRRARRCAGAPAELPEANPMLGHRGCRLGITYPEIYEMQARAIFEAALAVAKETGQRAGARDHDPAGRHASASWRSPARRSTASPSEVFAESRRARSTTSSAP